MLIIDGLNKSYGKNQVLFDVRLEIPQGQVVALLGPSGSGKSTLLRCINLLEKPDDGFMQVDKVQIDLSKITKNQTHIVRQQSAMVFQHYNLFKNKTAIENITESLILNKKISKPEANDIGMELLKKVGLEAKAQSYPVMLSGGQQQRVAIARALAVKPKVMLLDEPTSALDPELVNEVLNVIRSIIDHQTTIMLVTHEMSFANDIADRIIFMADGRIIEDATPGKFFNNPSHERTKKFLQTVSMPST